MWKIELMAMQVYNEAVNVCNFKRKKLLKQ